MEAPPNSIDDRTLIRQISQGNDEALGVLMNRHDRIVRYTIFRVARAECLRDPQWLDAVAVETWQGLVQAARREVELKGESAAGYLSGVARQQTLSALRRSKALHSEAISEGAFPQSEAESDCNPAVIIEQAEALEVLRSCIAELPREDQELFSQLGSITQKRWSQAGAALGLSESTLRSKWGQVVGRLGELFRKKS